MLARPQLPRLSVWRAELQVTVKPSYVPLLTEHSCSLAPTFQF